MNCMWKKYYLLFFWLVIIHRQKLRPIYSTNIFKERAHLILVCKTKTLNFPYTVLSFEFTALIALKQAYNLYLMHI